MRRRASERAGVTTFVFAVALVLSLSAPAWADRGALSAELGGGLEGSQVPAPYVVGASATRGVTPSLTGGARYSVRNWLDLSVSGFFNFPLTYWHDGGSVVTRSGTLPGSLSHQLTSGGATVGVRMSHGEALRVVLGCELGWMHRSYSQFTAWSDSDPSNVAPYALSPPLPDLSLDNIVLAPALGLEWEAGDHYSFALVPRVQLVMGKEPTVALMLPLTFSWSWYL